MCGRADGGVARSASAVRLDLLEGDVLYIGGLSLGAAGGDLGEANVVDGEGDEAAAEAAGAEEAWWYFTSQDTTFSPARALQEQKVGKGLSPREKNYSIIIFEASRGGTTGDATSWVLEDSPTKKIPMSRANPRHSSDSFSPQKNLQRRRHGGGSKSGAL